MFTRFLRWLGLSNLQLPPAPKVFSRSAHTLSRRDISKQALKVLYRLHEAGYQAYLVGGGVRDVLLGLHPKDFDVATNALPEDVADLFRNSRLIGRRFRLVHVHFGQHIVEVATFRSSPLEEVADSTAASLQRHKEGMLLRDNVYGTLDEDVFRRDFTVNALYYNIADYTVIDYVGGMKDLKAGVLRMIGDAKKRYREDPVRMLRAIRFAAKLKFKIHSETAAPILELGHLLTHVPAARVFDEYSKLFLSGYALESFRLLRQYRLFSIFFPKTDWLLSQAQPAALEGFLKQALQNTDERFQEEKPISPYFLLATFLWFPCQLEAEKLQQQGVSGYVAQHLAFEEILHTQRNNFSIPRRLTQVVKEIWSLQFRLTKRGQHRAAHVYGHPRFRAAYDFLLLRAQTLGGEAKELASWWTTYIQSDEVGRRDMAFAIKETGRRRRKGRPNTKKHSQPL